MAEKFADNKGTLKGFALVAGGVGSRWYDATYFNKLQKELHDLVRFVPRHTAELKQFLSSSPRSFKEIGEDLPDILISIASSMKNAELATAAKRWAQSRDQYYRRLVELERELADDEDNAPAPKPAPKPSITGQQASQVDLIVSDVLRRLPKSVAGDIRNAIARMPNKLQALQQELQRRNIKMGESVVRGWQDL
jgi:hypothetical protein